MAEVKLPWMAFYAVFGGDFLHLGRLGREETALKFEIDRGCTRLQWLQGYLM